MNNFLRMTKVEVYLLVMCIAFAMNNYKLRNIEGKIDGYGQILHNTGQHIYVLETSYVRLMHYIGRHDGKAVGCPECVNFIKEQISETYGEDERNKIINEATDYKDFQQKNKALARDMIKVK